MIKTTANLGRQFLDLGPLFPGDSSLYQVDTNLPSPQITECILPLKFSDTSFTNLSSPIPLPTPTLTLKPAQDQADSWLQGWGVVLMMMKGVRSRGDFKRRSIPSPTSSAGYSGCCSSRHCLQSSPSAASTGKGRADPVFLLPLWWFGDYSDHTHSLLGEAWSLMCAFHSS